MGPWALGPYGGPLAQNKQYEFRARKNMSLGLGLGFRWFSDSPWVLGPSGGPSGGPWTSKNKCEFRVHKKYEFRVRARV